MRGNVKRDLPSYFGATGCWGVTLTEPCALTPEMADGKWQMADPRSADFGATSA